MKKYETVVVFNPNFGESQLQEEINKVKDIITNKKGVDISINNWGKRQIAYAVKKFSYGYYVTYTYGSESSDCLKEINGLLRISETVIKFQSHKIDLPKRKFKGNPKKVSQRNAAAAAEASAGADLEY